VDTLKSVSKTSFRLTQFLSAATQRLDDDLAGYFQKEDAAPVAAVAAPAETMATEEKKE